MVKSFLIVLASIVYNYLNLGLIYSFLLNNQVFYNKGELFNTVKFENT